MTCIFHLSDIHFGREDRAALADAREERNGCVDSPLFCSCLLLDCATERPQQEKADDDGDTQDDRKRHRDLLHLAPGRTHTRRVRGHVLRHREERRESYASTRGECVR